MIKAFSFERVHKAGAKFDIQKANWFNQQYLKEKDDLTMAAQVQPLFAEKGIEISDEQAIQIVHLLKDRVHFVKDIVSESAFLFSAPESYDQEIVAKKWNEEAARGIGAFAGALGTYEGPFLGDDIKHLLAQTLEAAEIKMGKIMQALRVAITGVGAGPDLMITMEILGKAEVVRRLRRAVDVL